MWGSAIPAGRRPRRLAREAYRMAEAEPTLDILRAGVQLACKPQNAGRIVTARNQVLAIARNWVLSHAEQVAAESLDLSDYWEHRRLLELAELLDAKLVRRLARLGLDSSDPDVREAADDFAAKHRTGS